MGVISSPQRGTQCAIVTNALVIRIVEGWSRSVIRSYGCAKRDSSGWLGYKLSTVGQEYIEVTDCRGSSENNCFTSMSLNLNVIINQAFPFKAGNIDEILCLNGHKESKFSIYKLSNAKHFVLKFYA